MISPTLMPMRNWMLFFGGDVAIALKHAALNVDGATHRVNNADKFDQHPVARSFYDAIAVFGNFRINELFAVPLKLAEGAFLVCTH